MKDQNNDGEIETQTDPQAADIGVLQAPNRLRKNRTVISKSRDCFIEILHRDSDPGTWIVRGWKKTVFFKKRISSDWFTNEQQAFVYANEMIKNNRHHSLYDAKEM